MEEAGANNANIGWHDNMLELNRMISLHSTQLVANLDMMKSSNDVLEQRRDSLAKECRELETACSMKQQQLKDSLQVYAWLKAQIAHVNRSAALKRAQVSLLQSMYKEEAESAERRDRTTDTVYKLCAQSVREAAGVLESAPLAGERTALRAHLLNRSQQLAALTASIDDEVARQQRRRQLAKRRQQALVVKLAQLMAEYGNMRASARRLAESRALLLAKQQELEERRQLAPKSDNIFSEDVKVIDSLMRADCLKVSPLKSIKIHFSSDDEYEADCLPAYVTAYDCPSKHEPPSPSPSPSPSKKARPSVTQQSAGGGNAAVGDSGTDVAKLLLLRPPHHYRREEQRCLADLPASGPEGAGPMPERRARPRASLLYYSGVTLGGIQQDERESQPPPPPPPKPVPMETKSVFFENDTGAAAAAPPPPPPPPAAAAAAAGSHAPVTAPTDCRAEGRYLELSDATDDDGVHTSANNHSFTLDLARTISPVTAPSTASSSSSVRVESPQQPAVVGRLGADAFDMFGARANSEQPSSSSSFNSFSFTFGEAKQSAHTRFNIFS